MIVIKLMWWALRDLIFARQYEHLRVAINRLEPPR